ncbi:hypothetical protein [Capybara microvirus Cap3_SP_431]|nr:hypothetical protein [Capybara microvirus Cap3_SP_431]
MGKKVDDATLSTCVGGKRFPPTSPIARSGPGGRLLSMCKGRQKGRERNKRKSLPIKNKWSLKRDAELGAHLAVDGVSELVSQFLVFVRKSKDFLTKTSAWYQWVV